MPSTMPDPWWVFRKLFVEWKNDGMNVNFQSRLDYVFAKTDPSASRALHIFSILCCPGDCLLNLLRQWILTFGGSWTLLRIWKEQWSLFSKNAQTQTHDFADAGQLWARVLNLIHCLSQTIPALLPFIPTELLAPSPSSHNSFFLIWNNNSLFCSHMCHLGRARRCPLLC